MMKTLDNSIDTQHVKLRTINKDRSQHRAANPESPLRNSDQELPIITGRKKAQIPLSRLKTINYNDRSFQSQTSQISEAVKNSSYSAKFINKLDELDKKAEQLIEKRLQKILNEQNDGNMRNSRIMMRRDDQYEPEFEKLIHEIRQLRDDQLQKNNYDSRQLQKLMDKKIKLLQKLMAEKCIQAEVIKKYYFSIGALSRKRQPKTRITNLLAKLQNTKNPESKQNPKSQVCNESWNKNSFKAPKTSQYQTYRYNAPKFVANPQPLPRSSYKAEYLTYGSDDQKLFCKNMDSHSFFGSRRKGENGSTYSRDYKSLKTEPINYKQLDSYRNKIRNIQVSYIFKKNEQNQEANQNYRDEQNLERMLYTRRPQNQFQKTSSNLLQKSSKNLSNSRLLGTSTQARSQYKGELNEMASSIKNKQLTSLKYIYKNVVHS